jgi:hypothetical protein
MPNEITHDCSQGNAGAGVDEAAVSIACLEVTRQPVVSAAESMERLGSFADDALVAEDDVRHYGERVARMLSGAYCAVALAPAHEKRSVFRDVVAATMAHAVADRQIPKQVMMDRLQQIAEAHSGFDLSPDELQKLIAEAAEAIPVPQVVPVPVRQARRLITHRASDLKPEQLVWVWPGRIAQGKLCLLGGPPGLGKSQLTIFVTATISNGGVWPCQEGATTAGSVLFLSAEDGIRDTIVPRLMAAGANMDCVHLVAAATKPDGTGRKTFSLKSDIDLLEKKAREIGDVRLIVIDPISAYMDGADGNGNVETRAVMEPLSEMADRLGIAVLAVTHLNKGGGGGQTAMNRFCGSIAFVAAARTAFLLVADAENPERRFLLEVKNNLAQRAQGLAFRLEQRVVAEGIVASNVIFFDEQVSLSVEQALAAHEGQGRGAGKSGATGEARDFLSEVLAGGPVEVGEVERQARLAGLLEEGKRIGQSKAFRDARKALEVASKRDGYGPGARYMMSLPSAPCAPDTDMCALPQNRAHMDNMGAQERH